MGEEEERRLKIMYWYRAVYGCFLDFHLLYVRQGVYISCNQGHLLLLMSLLGRLLPLEMLKPPLRIFCNACAEGQECCYPSAHPAHQPHSTISFPCADKLCQIINSQRDSRFTFKMQCLEAESAKFKLETRHTS